MAIRQSSEFGALLRQYRVAAGLTQEALAEQAGLSARGIADLERGARRFPQPATLKRLATSLQLSSSDFAALSHAGNQRHANALPAWQRPTPALPIPPTSFVGRDADLAEVQALLPTTRALTLTGVGGVGKTRLALALARDVAAAYADGVWFVDLGPLADGSLVPKTVASVLGIREQPGRPLVSVICEALGERSLLLVLDNCEHIAMDCASLVQELLQRCPAVRALLTSREALRVAGETLWRVPSLRVPDPRGSLTAEDLRTYGAAQLFLERAGPAAVSLVRSERDVTAIAHICRQLDGVPLAIELAAARTRMFSVEQIADRLDHAMQLLSSGVRTAPRRQQTLRATIDWSYGLLSATDQLLLDRLSVFAGGFTFEAAEAIASGAGIAAEDVVDLVGGLVDRSLVVTEPGSGGRLQYRLLGVIAQYGLERLAERGELDATRQRHATYFLDLAEEAEPEVLGPQRKPWLDRLESALDEFRAARRWFIRCARTSHASAESAYPRATEHAIRLAAALYRLWMYRGYTNEGRATIAETLALDGGSPAARAKVMFCDGGLGVMQADYARAQHQLEASLGLRREVGDAVGTAWSLMGMGATATVRADFAAAGALLSEARDLSRTHGGPAVLALSLAWSADMAYAHGDFADAQAYATDGLAVAESTGFATPACMCLSTLGNLSWRRGDRLAAEQLLDAAQARAEALDEAYLIVRAAIGRAFLAIDSGDTELARALLARCLRRAQHVGNRHHVALAVEGLAVFAASSGAPEAALRLASAASALRGQIGAPLTPTEAEVLDARLVSARRRLDASTVATAVSEGKTWSAEQAIGYALEVTTAPHEVATLPSATAGLTRRELEVARLVARGLRNQDVASELVINVKTAKNHVQHVLEKLGVNSRSQVIARAQEFGLQ